MGKKHGKKKNSPARKTTQPTNSNPVLPDLSESNKTAADQGDRSKIVHNKSANKSMLLSYSVKCGICKGPNKPKEWLIQCDDCDAYYHFECVQIMDIGPEDPWSCPFCKQREVEWQRQQASVQSNDKVNASNNGERPRHESMHQSTEDLISRPLNRREVSERNNRDDDTSTIFETTQHPSERSKEWSTISSSKLKANDSKLRAVPSIRTLSSVRTKESTDISISSSQRQTIQLQKIQDELELQSKIDAETLALKLEAIKMKERREKKFLDDKYETLMNPTVSGSAGGSQKTDRSSFVFDWIDDQRKQTITQSNDPDARRFSERIDQVDFNLSIPVEPYEQERVKKQLLLEEAMASFKQELRSKQSTSYLPSSSTRNPGILKNTQPIKWPDNELKRTTSSSYPQSSSTQLKISPKDVIPRTHPQSIDLSNNRPQQITFESNGRSYDSRFTQAEPKISYRSTQRHQSQYSNIDQTNSSYVPPASESTEQFDKHQDRPASNQQPSLHSQRTPRSLSSANGNQLSQAPVDHHRSTDNRGPLLTNQIASRYAIKKDLPKFNGDPREWPRFIKKFEQTTRMCGYTDDENLDRLNDCLEGKAREIVESQLMMPDCVNEVLEMLEQKFGRPELVIKSALTQIRSESSIKPDKLEDLSNYGYKVRNLCNTIIAMNIRYHLFNPELILELVEKLPPQTKIEWVRFSESLPQITLVELSDWLYSLSRSLNRITTPDILNKSKSESDTKKGHINVHDGNTSKESLVKENWTNVDVSMNNNQMSNNKTSKCIMCSKGCNSLSDCAIFKALSVADRWKNVIEHKLCRVCLKQHGRRCNLAKACGVNGCVFKHNSILHDDQRYNNNSRQTNQPSREESKKLPVAQDNTVQSTPTGPCNIHFQQQGEIFRIVPVTLSSKGISIKTFAFLDEGSTFTLMERHIAKALKIDGKPERICLLWTNNVHRQEDSEIVELEISGQYDPLIRYKLKNVNVVEDLHLPEQSLPIEELKRRYEHLTELPVMGYKSVTPTIMIGLKHARLSVPLETVEGGVDDPIATRSRLGWSIHGPLCNSSTGFVNTHRVRKCPCADRDEEIHKLIKNHFTIENFGVLANNACEGSKEDAKALEMLKEFSVRKNNRFESRLLWKNEFYKLPDSYPMARKRLTCLENKGSKVINTINESVQDYMKKGYVSKLTASEKEQHHDRVWYLPLFTVVNPKKPEKLRTVFDAAAKVKGVSLNSVLFTGPDFSASIVDILRRFRQHRIGINGDIKEMYHQVTVNERDRHAQRFLWRNGEKGREPDEYVVNVLTFGATCSPSTAQFIKNLNAMEFVNEYPRAVEAITKNHYVDDLMDGAESTNEAVKLINEVKYVHDRGGFEIRNFKSNSVEVLKAIGEPINEDDRVSVDDGAKTERVLGMFWDTRTDCFTFSLKFTKITTEVLSRMRLPTKRELLKLLMSIFDPLGLLSYYLIHLKIVLQEIWRTKLGWDDPIPNKLINDWTRWIEILPKVEQLKIPRWYKNDLTLSNDTVQLHIFVDASEGAYSAVAYLRFETDVGYSCSLIGSKARVAPIKYLSITRKELCAALLGARLSKSLREGLSLKIDRLVIWSDSMTALTWLHSDHRKYTQFVAHRVGEILEITDLSEWRWVPTKQNVADEATKWTKTPTFDSKDRWFTAPEFLNLPEVDWPKQPESIEPDSTKDEMKLSCSHLRLIMPSIVDHSRFSKWQRIIRSVAFALRWCNILLSKVRKVKSPQGPLTQNELLKAELLIYKQAQWESFTDEMITLVRNQKNPQKQRAISQCSSIRDCTPYLDEEGVLRVQGRIDNATALTKDAKRPIIMPRRHKITHLLVLSYHVKFMHKNHETVINELKQRFYIPRVRVMYRSVRWNCKVCEIKRCRPIAPQMADLPAIRFETGVRAFTYTGIDYFGPIKVMVRRTPEKRWAVLMTCLTIRAIHIELVSSYDTESCIKALRNFINIRGRPREIFSDNGTYFKGADNELERELKKLNLNDFSEYFTSSYTKWNFIPPASPHMGGTWERLIQTVKSCMEVSLFSRTPKEEDLRSLLLEIMNVVNSRPLTFIPLETNESEALTPNHFLLGSSNGLKPPGLFSNEGPYLRSAWKEIQRCTDIFWKRFVTEYIPTLTRKTKWFEMVKPLEVGDIVINFDETQPRNTYNRARVVETIIGSKNQVRRAKIQMANGNTLWRPAVKLGVLDVQHSAPPTTESLDRIHTAQNWGENVGAANSNNSPNNEQIGLSGQPRVNHQVDRSM